MLKFNRTQVLMLLLLLALLLMTPFLSSSLRPAYLYFIFNLLLISLGAEAGLLSCFSNTQDHKTHTPTSSSFLATQSSLPISPSETREPSTPPLDDSSQIASTLSHNDDPDHDEKKRTMGIKKCTSEKIRGVSTEVDKHEVKKSKSMTNLFFIENVELEEDEVYDQQVDDDDDEDADAYGGINGQELFAKAESFIRNFYKELKMQKEDSWKKINGFY